MENPYLSHVESYARLMRQGSEIPLGGFDPAARPAPAADAPQALVFSAHPDDECLTGALSLRLQREAGWRVVNVAVTQGSRKDRQAARWEELGAACRLLGFELVQTRPGGLERINPKTRAAEAEYWQSCVLRIKEIILARKPRAVFVHHADDWNSTHIGTHHLVLDALALKIVSGEVREGDCVSVEVENDEIAVIAPARQTLRRTAKVAV